MFGWRGGCINIYISQLESTQMTPDELMIFPDLPPLPRELYEASDAYDTSKQLAKQIDRICTRKGIKFINTPYDRFDVSPGIKNWVHEHVGTDYTDIGVSIHGAGWACPHHDTSRNWTLIWLLRTGGPAVDTIHWLEEGKPYIRPLVKEYPKTYDNLTEICRHRMPVGEWYLINAQVLHSIEPMPDGGRTAIQIGFWDDSPTIARLKALGVKRDRRQYP
jgi:hypothetical protein